MDNFWESVAEFFENAAAKLILLAIVLVLGILLSRAIMAVLKKALGKTKIQHTVKTFIISVVRILLYSFVAITALEIIGFNVSSIIAALGAAAVTAGLAIQDTLKNFVSGIIILVNKPFVAGDYLEFENMTGSVEAINVFYTTLLDIDLKHIRIPNSRLTANNVVNCSMEKGRRMYLRYTVSYEDDIRKVRKVIFDVINSYDKTKDHPDTEVCVGKHLESGMEIVVKIWVDPTEYYPIYYYMQEHIKLAFDENGITIPYPHVVLKNDTKELEASED